MSLFNLFKDKGPRSADVARERLKVIVAHERNQRNAPDYLPALQRDIMAVIRKYVEIDQDQLQVDLNEEGNYSILEVNVNLPK